MIPWAQDSQIVRCLQSWDNNKDKKFVWMVSSI